MKEYIINLMQPTDYRPGGWQAVPFGPYTLDEAMEILRTEKIRLNEGDYLDIAHLRTLGD